MMAKLRMVSWCSTSRGSLWPRAPEAEGFDVAGCAGDRRGDRLHELPRLRARPLGYVEQHLLADRIAAHDAAFAHVLAARLELRLHQGDDRRLGLDDLED